MTGLYPCTNHWLDELSMTKWPPFIRVHSHNMRILTSKETLQTEYPIENIGDVEPTTV